MEGVGAGGVAGLDYVVMLAVMLVCQFMIEFTVYSAFGWGSVTAMVSRR